LDESHDFLTSKDDTFVLRIASMNEHIKW
jgi:hypothetical protein